MKRKILVVLSGGKNSVIALFWAKQNFDAVHAITFDYKQHQRSEIDAAKAISKLAGVQQHEVLKLDGALCHNNSSLAPMRNILFLSIAANRARLFEISDIVTGIREEDSPESHEVFVRAAQDAIDFASDTQNRPFRIHTPLLLLTQDEIDTLAANLPGCNDALQGAINAK